MHLISLYSDENKHALSSLYEWNSWSNELIKTTYPMRTGQALTWIGHNSKRHWIENKYPTRESKLSLLWNLDHCWFIFTLFLLPELPSQTHSTTWMELRPLLRLKYMNLDLKLNYPKPNRVQIEYSNWSRRNNLICMYKYNLQLLHFAF